MKGKIPITQTMILESQESQWALLSTGLITELKTSAIIELSKDSKIRINLVLTEIWSPRQMQCQVTCQHNTNIDPASSQGLIRITDFMNNMLEKNKWLFLGYIDGDNKIPIVINYFVAIDLFIYSQKIQTESKKDFLEIARQN